MKALVRAIWSGLSPFSWKEHIMWSTVIGVMLGTGLGLSIRPYLRWEARQQDRALARDLGQRDG